MTDDELKLKYPKKNKFKNEVKKKAIHLTEEFIISKKERHTKLDDLNFNKLKCASYLLDPRINQREAKLLFRLRTRMYKVKANYKGQHLNNLTCKLCKSATCDQRHLMECSVLKSHIPDLNNNTEVKYSHLFSSDNEKIVPAIKLFFTITRKREELLEEQQNHVFNS